MKKIVKKTKELIKGAPTAVLVSAGIHIVLIFLAGGLVVFSVVKKKEKKFEPPPPVEREKMELKKPKVKVKKQARPKASQRISTKNVQAMTDFQLPESSSMGEGLGGGIGGFEIVPDVTEMSLFGANNSAAVGNDFEGTFFSLAYNNKGNRTGIGQVGVWQVIKTFHNNNWNPRVFMPYYKSPQKLYTTHFMIPPFRSNNGPKAFGLDNPDFMPLNWIVYYKGKIASHEDGRFRFWGSADEILAVRINGEVVFVSTWSDAWNKAIPFEPESDLYDKYYMTHSGAGVGNWFELEEGVSVEMEVLLEENGGLGGFVLSIQKEGEIYPKNKDGMPILPAFKTAEFDERTKAQIEYGTIPGEFDLNSDVMFNVY